MTVAWADGHVSRFPFIWLRHHSFYPSVGRPDQPPDRPYLIPEDPNAPEILQVSQSDDSLVIAWLHDGSETRHSLAELRDRCISQEERSRRQPKAVLWDAEAVTSFPWFTAADLEIPERRLAIFERLVTYGLVFLKDCGTCPGSLLDLARPFGAVRRSHFGELFDIRSSPNDNRGSGANIGATDFKAQAPHVDDGFRHGIIGINFFHMLKAHEAGEGESLFVDGFRAAEALRRADPEAFAFLTSVPLQFAAERNPEELFRTKRRMIATDAEGAVRGVCVSDRTFPPMNLPEAQIEPAYRSLRAFGEQLARESFTFKHLLREGELAIFDNHRVLHARTAFDPQASARHLQQLSVDREEFHNSFRRLAGELRRWDLANLDFDAGALSQR